MTDHDFVVKESYSSEESFALGEMIGKEADPGDLIALSGDLGAGKTLFAQGIAKGLGIVSAVSSPTFTIVHVYEEGRIPFYHFDVYRIKDPDEMDEIGYEDYFYGNGLCVVEWADLIQGILPEIRIEVSIEKDLSQGADYRKLTIRKVK